MSTNINFQDPMLGDGASMSGLEVLAPELLLVIVTQIPDLVSLDSLLRASPAAFRLFEDFSVEITEAILSSGFTHAHICVIIRIVALIRSSTLPITKLWDFQTYIAEEAMRYRVPKSKRGFAPSHLAKKTTPAVLRSILATNRQITFYALDCLKSNLSRFKALQPEHLLDPNFRFYAKWGLPAKDINPIWQRRPEGKKFKVQDFGPPTWVEEQRIIRAFWRLQVFYDIKTAAAHSMIDWSDKDIRYLNLWYRSYSTPIRVDLMYGNEDDFPHKLHPETDELRTVVDYIEEMEQSDPFNFFSTRQNWLGSRVREVKREWDISIPGENDWKALLSVASGPRHYYKTIRDDWFAVRGLFTPLRYTSFAPYRRLGFAFWDSQRLELCGFVSPLEDLPEDHRHIYSFAWLSILMPDDIREVEKKAEAAWTVD